ncbi:hypothetical protein [Veronia nyctiphanis]|nr:hypothetical protein [Veronia nyctiphanis]
MRYDIQQDIVKRLISDYAMKENGDWLQQGTCLHAGRKNSSHVLKTHG